MKSMKDYLPKESWWCPWMVGFKCCMMLITPDGEQLELREFDGTKEDGLGKLLWRKEDEK